MNTTFSHPVLSQGLELDTSPEAFGWLHRSADLLDAAAPALHERMDRDGYLFLPGLLDTDHVLSVRRLLLEQLQRSGHLHPNHPLMDGVLGPALKAPLDGEALQHDPTIRSLLFAGPMMDFARRYFAEDVRHFDFVWFRSMGRGNGTPPHCDIVYMGRGTQRLCTAWIPYGEVDLELGGLMVLEDSHRQAERIRSYLDMDVDTYCANRAPKVSPHPHGWRISGALSKNPRTLREKLGGRWLTAEFRPGDVLFFGMNTVHASLDNQTDRVRLSTDTRYQRAREAIDERWIGEKPIGHGTASRRGLIC